MRSEEVGDPSRLLDVEQQVRTLGWPSLPFLIASGQDPTGLFLIATADERVLGSLPAFLNGSRHR
jgi:hypothetical protein